MVKVFQPNADRIAKLGFASVAHVPVIFDSRQRYCRAIFASARNWTGGPLGALVIALALERSKPWPTI